MIVINNNNNDNNKVFIVPISKKNSKTLFTGCKKYKNKNGKSSIKFLKIKCFQSRFKNIKARTIFDDNWKLVPKFWPCDRKCSVSIAPFRP